MNLRAIVFGGAGTVGSLIAKLAPAGASVIAYNSAAVDIRDAIAVRHAICDSKPDVIFNCAAWTQVDKAEICRNEAMLVNAEGPAIIGAIALESRARVVHLSTDYVFNGRSGAPYSPDDPTDPLNVYGATKLEGERRLLSACPDALVIRTAWIHSGQKSSFIATAVRKLTGGSCMQVVDDQIGTPTRAAHLATAMWLAARRPALHGVIHFTDAGVASWFDVAACVSEVLRAAGRIADNITVSPAPSVDFPRPALRPRCAVLDKHSSWRRLGWIPPQWRVGVSLSTEELLNA